MDYIELVCVIKSENTEEINGILIAELSEIGYESFDESSEGVKAYIQDKLFDFEKVKELQVNFLSNCIIDLSWKLIKSENWNEKWEKNFEPISVDNRCTIRAPFHTNMPKMEFEIVIEPKMSFGTGHHETTYLMVKSMLNIEFTGMDVLDMGCGTGILAILASLKGAKNITAIDIDEWAYQNSIENIEKNKCSNISVFQGDAELIKNKSFDIILANINRNILLNDLVYYSNSLKDNGLLLLSGIYETDLEKIKEEAQKQNLVFKSFDSKNNWVAASFRKVN